jgi:DNA-binding FadR family transcriptional regulator
VGNGDTINKCEEVKLQEVAKAMYPEDHDRAQILIEAVHEFYEKIVEHNNLVYDSLIYSIAEDIKRTPRFSKKIDSELFSTLKECIDEEEEQLFHDRIVTFLNDLKEEYGEL